MTRSSVEPVQGDRISRWRTSETTMMRREKFAIANIYVPIKRRATLKPGPSKRSRRVFWKSDILVRRDGDRFVLVHGLHRLEACKALGTFQVIGPSEVNAAR